MSFPNRFLHATASGVGVKIARAVRVLLVVIVSLIPRWRDPSPSPTSEPSDPRLRELMEGLIIVVILFAFLMLPALTSIRVCGTSGRHRVQSITTEHQPPLTLRAHRIPSSVALCDYWLVAGRVIRSFDPGPVLTQSFGRNRTSWRELISRTGESPHISSSSKIRTWFLSSSLSVSVHRVVSGTPRQYLFHPLRVFRTTLRADTTLDRNS